MLRGKSPLLDVEGDVELVVVPVHRLSVIPLFVSPIELLSFVLSPIGVAEVLSGLVEEEELLEIDVCFVFHIFNIPRLVPVVNRPCATSSAGTSASSKHKKPAAGVTDSTVPGWSIRKFYVYSFVSLQTQSETDVSRLSFPTRGVIRTFDALSADLQLHFTPAESAAKAGLIKVGTGTANLKTVANGLLRCKARLVYNLLSRFKRTLKERLGAALF